MKTVHMPKKEDYKVGTIKPAKPRIPAHLLLQMRSKFHNGNWRKESRQQAKRNLNRDQ